MAEVTIDEDGREVAPAPLGSTAEIDAQIATAKQHPRSIRTFQARAIEMATLTHAVAEECVYALPRDGKSLQGPSARLAEIVAAAWGNCRASARIVSETGEHVVAQGAFHDLESNHAIGFEVSRRIVDKHGRRFSPDMIGVTATAACSIALRNAVLKGVPKAMWQPVYKAAMRTIVGDAKSFAARRDAALMRFADLGAPRAAVFAALEISGEADLSTDHLITLAGMLTSLENGESSVEAMFGIAADAGESDAGRPAPHPPFLSGRRADEHVRATIELFEDARSEEELDQVAADAARRVRVSDNRIHALAEAHAANLERLRDEAGEEARREDDPAGLGAAPSSLQLFEQLRDGLERCLTSADLDAWVPENLSVETLQAMNEEHVAQLRAIWRDKKDTLAAAEDTPDEEDAA